VVHKFLNSVLFLLCINLLLPFGVAEARILFVHDVFENDSETFQIGSDDDAASTTLTLEFGGTNTERLQWDTTGFSFSDDLSLNDNQITDVRIENVSALPGGVAGLGAGGEGRLVILDTIDIIAPGCTVLPNCGAAPYLWDGSTWISLTEATSSTLTKMVTVGATGYDYTTIEDTATYLNARGGGIMLLAAETHAVTTEVNLTNITLLGKDASNTTIVVSGSGELNVSETFFKYLTLDVNAITKNYALDTDSAAATVAFEFVDTDLQDAGDSLIDSSLGAAPTINVKLLKVNNAGGSGTILKATGTGNLNTSSFILVESSSGSTPIDLQDWNVTLLGGGAVNTSGIITPVPADSIFVSPNMNLQAAIDSIEFVGNGGTITLLPGTHSISSPITIEDDNIALTGFGEASVIQTGGTFAGITDVTAAIQMGLADGSAPVDGVSVSNLRLEVQDDAIHGVRSAGGTDNRVENVTVIKTAGTSGSGGTANVGIHFIDGTAEQLIRPVIVGNRVLGTSGTIYFTDGIHVTSDPTITGVFGNNQGVVYALIDGNNIDYVAETGLVFVGVTDSSMFNNRVSRMGVSGGYGIFIGNVDNVIMSSNVFTGSLTTTVNAIGIEDFNTGGAKSTTDSIFVNNIIDGEANSGLGFATGFVIGDAANTTVSRNIFQNNTINGAGTGVTIAIGVEGDADSNTFSDNTIAGGTNAWDTGISLGGATQDQNLIGGNRFTNVTATVLDSGTATQVTTTVHKDSTNPSVNEDSGDGYIEGMVWVNTSDDTSFILVDDNVGAAVWHSLVPRVIDVYDGTGVTAVANGTQNVLNLDTTRTVDADAFSIAADVVTIAEAGLYQVSAHITAREVDTTGANRDHIQLYAQDDTGGAFADIAGAYCEDYIREDTGDRIAASCSFDYIQAYGAGDQVRLVHESSRSTTMETVPEGSGMTIVRLR
jgi:hypothetical protein